MKLKSHNWIEAKAIVQFPLRKVIFGNIGQNLHKTRYQSFLVLSNFASFSYFWPCILPITADTKFHPKENQSVYIA